MTVEEAIRQMQAAGYSKSRAAKELGINTETLNAFIRDLSIDWPLPANTRPGRMPAKIKRNQRLIDDIEAEYGQPLLEVARTYALSGESQTSTAEILGLNRVTFRRIPGMAELPWPKTSNARAAWLQSTRRRTPAIQSAARRNLSKARADRATQRGSR